LIAKKIDSHGSAVLIGGKHLQTVTTHPEYAYPEYAPVKIDVISFILHGNKTCQNGIPPDLPALFDFDLHGQIFLRLPQTKNAGNTSYHNDIFACQNRSGSRVPHFVDHLINRGVFLNIGIARWDIGFRLVIIVVGHKVLHGVVRKEGQELIV